jgi:hypothetical protein
MVVGSRLFNIPNAGDVAAGDWVPCAYGCGEMGSRMKIKLHERGDYCPRKLAIQQFEAMSTKDRTTVNGVSKEPIFEIGQVVAVFDNMAQALGHSNHPMHGTKVKIVEVNPQGGSILYEGAAHHEHVYVIRPIQVPGSFMHTMVFNILEPMIHAIKPEEGYIDDSDGYVDSSDEEREQEEVTKMKVDAEVHEVR